MVVGLGIGFTAYFAVECVGEKLKSGELKDVIAIPTSIRTKEQAEELRIPLVTLDTHSKLDGADDVDPDLNFTKGGGGALFREKIVEVCAEKFIVIGKCHFFLSERRSEEECDIGYFFSLSPFLTNLVPHIIVTLVDESKICDGLGPGFPIPVEIVPFCHEHTMRTIGELPILSEGGL